MSNRPELLPGWKLIKGFDDRYTVSPSGVVWTNGDNPKPLAVKKRRGVQSIRLTGPNGIRREITRAKVQQLAFDPVRDCPVVAELQYLFAEV